MEVDSSCTSHTVYSICTVAGVPSDVNFCIQVVGLEVSLHQDEKQSIDRVRINQSMDSNPIHTLFFILLESFDLSTLVSNVRVHSLDVWEEGVGDRRWFLHS